MYVRLFSRRIAFTHNTNLVSSANLQEFLMSVSDGCQIFLRCLGSQEILYILKSFKAFLC